MCRALLQGFFPLAFARNSRCLYVFFWYGFLVGVFGRILLQGSFVVSFSVASARDSSTSLPLVNIPRGSELLSEATKNPPTKEPCKRALQKSPAKDCKRALRKSPAKEPYQKALQKSLIVAGSELKIRVETQFRFNTVSEENMCDVTHPHMGCDMSLCVT